MQKLPIGIQNFSEIRGGNYLYVDKTESIFRLVTQGKYYFLSRPRRFGKSLLISTLVNFFGGKKELFKDLWVYDKHDWKASPVVHLDFSKIPYKTEGLATTIHETITTIGEGFGVQFEASESYPSRFKKIIQQLGKHEKVVILIDEYDKPIVDYIENYEKANENREILRNLYSVIKGSDEYIRFFFMTGISTFAKVSLFSELNNLQNITLGSPAADLCGYTQKELEYYFPELLTEPDTKQKIKEWYNGYSWDGKTLVYNPFSILNYASKLSFENFWFDSGTPRMLVKMLSKALDLNLENLETSVHALVAYDIEKIRLLPLLFQTGYLTIKSIDEFEIYTLSYPNKEVKESLNTFLLAEQTDTEEGLIAPIVIKMAKALAKNDIENFVVHINRLLSSIPYTIFIANKEAYYHSVIYLSLQLMGFYIQCEVSDFKGRADAVVQTSDRIYILEFKLDSSAEKAIEQIKNRNYGKRFEQTDKQIVRVGVNFASNEKQITDWKVEIS